MNQVSNSLFWWMGITADFTDFQVGWGIVGAITVLVMNDFGRPEVAAVLLLNFLLFDVAVVKHPTVFPGTWVIRADLDLQVAFTCWADVANVAMRP